MFYDNLAWFGPAYWSYVVSGALLIKLPQPPPYHANARRRVRSSRALQMIARYVDARIPAAKVAQILLAVNLGLTIADARLLFGHSQVNATDQSAIANMQNIRAHWS